jgi:hypothetical protein
MKRDDVAECAAEFVAPALPAFPEDDPPEAPPEAMGALT